MRPEADVLSSRSQADVSGPVRQLFPCRQSVEHFPYHRVSCVPDGHHVYMARTALSGGRKAPRYLSGHEICDRSVINNQPAHSAYQSRSFPPPVPRRSGRSPHETDKFLQSPSQGTALPSHCSPTSTKQRQFPS